MKIFLWLIQSKILNYRFSVRAYDEYLGSECDCGLFFYENVGESDFVREVNPHGDDHDGDHHDSAHVNDQLRGAYVHGGGVHTLTRRWQ